jgi:hypothetical protein
MFLSDPDGVITEPLGQLHKFEGVAVIRHLVLPVPKKIEEGK